MGRRLMLLALGALSCAPADKEAIYVDPRFAVGHQAIILEAIDAWHTAVPALKGDVWIDDRSEPTIILEAGQPPENADEGRTTIGKSFPGATVRLWVSEISDERMFRAAVQHELGHYFGLLGHVSDGATMSDVYDEEAPICINAADIAALCEQRSDHGWGECGETFPDC